MTRRNSTPRPTRKAAAMAYAMQAPLDAPVAPLTKPKRPKRGDDDLPDWDGLHGTDGTNQ